MIALKYYIFRKEINRQIQPIIKQSPPNGVIGPRIGVSASVCINALVANKYKEPEKNKMPIEKLQPAKMSVLLANF